MRAIERALPWPLDAPLALRTPRIMKCRVGSHSREFSNEESGAMNLNCTYRFPIYFDELERGEKLASEINAFIAEEKKEGAIKVEIHPVEVPYELRGSDEVRDFYYDMYYMERPKSAGRYRLVALAVDTESLNKVVFMIFGILLKRAWSNSGGVDFRWN
jgi:hypothetical protein